MSARLVLAAIAACLSTVAVAQMGPGMDHRNMGPGMTGGQGMGPGMMGGQGMGSGMMGGHGMGPEMMGRHPMGPGMGGQYGMGVLAAANLNDEQRAKVKEIHRDLQRKRHALMGSLREARWQAQDGARSGEFDETAARRNYDAMAALRKQMFEANLESRKRIHDVLTKEQREQLRKAPRHH